MKTRPAVVVALLAAIVCFAVSSLAAASEPISAKEKELIDVVNGGEPADKALACKQLALHGTKACIPALEPLLGDERLASWARIALEAIPDPAADEALRRAAGTLKGNLLIGAINSIGVRRDAKAVLLLGDHLAAAEPEVAAAAAVALGRIGDIAANTTLQASLADGRADVRAAVAEGCILGAERLLAEAEAAGASTLQSPSNTSLIELNLRQATELFDKVRSADVPKQKVREATRGAILARQSEGIPLLLEQLHSPDKGALQMGLSVARELRGSEVAEALAAQLTKTSPDRAALLLYALADRPDPAIPAAVIEVAKRGDKQVRIAAVGFFGRRGDVSHLEPLLAIAGEGDAELSQAAKAALGTLAGEQVNAEIVARLAKADDQSLPLLIELVGLRRVAAAKDLEKALGHSQAVVRNAAISALGATAGPQEVALLIEQLVSPARPVDAQVAQTALMEACVRMPDRETCAAELATAVPKAALPIKIQLLQILAAMGGEKSLQTIAEAVRDDDEKLQDAGSRLLGEWMTLDAGPVLLDLVKTSPADKFKVRLLRGYIRLARQFQMPDQERAEMCQAALAASKRADEQKLVLQVLERYPSVDSLRVAVEAIQSKPLKQDAQRAALIIAQKVGGSADAQELLAKIGLDQVKVEIVKASYGAGNQQKDVTDSLRSGVGTTALIALPNPNYNESFGGDPAPGTVKVLKIEYVMNGKAGEATFAENDVIVLPSPK